MKRAKQHRPSRFSPPLLRRGRGHVFINGSYVGRAQLNRLPAVDRRPPSPTCRITIPGIDLAALRAIFPEPA
jgi:hypothetical protein